MASGRSTEDAISNRPSSEATWTGTHKDSSCRYTCMRQRVRRGSDLSSFRATNIPDQLYELTSVVSTVVSRAHASSSKSASCMLVLPKQQKSRHDIVEKRAIWKKQKEKQKRKRARKSLDRNACAGGEGGLYSKLGR